MQEIRNQMEWEAILEADHRADGLGMIYMFMRLITNLAVALRSKPGLAKRILQIVIPEGLKINYELFLQVLIEGMV